MSISNELVQEAKNGNRKATDEVIDSMAGMIHLLAAKFYKIQFHIAFDEYVQQGYIAVWDALRNFKIEKGFKFSTYATHCITFHFRKLAKPVVRRKDIGYPKISIEGLNQEIYSMKKINNREGYYTERDQDRYEKAMEIIETFDERDATFIKKKYMEKNPRIGKFYRKFNLSRSQAGYIQKKIFKTVRKHISYLDQLQDLVPVNIPGCS